MTWDGQEENVPPPVAHFYRQCLKTEIIIWRFCAGDRNFNLLGYSFAEIELLEDKYIKSIKATWAQINSYFALIEYDFTFKKPLDEESYNQFVYDNIRTLLPKII